MTKNNAPMENYPISFSGHDTFPLRHGWLEKAYKAVEIDKMENPFSSDDSIVRFGVGKNMVNAIKYWSTACNFLLKTQKGFRASDYARSLMEDVDPYLERIGSQWKIHYELSKNHYNTTIYWIFSLLNVPSFSKEYLETKLLEFCKAKNPKKTLPATKTLKTDINVALALYCHSKTSKATNEDDLSSPLHELQLMSVNSDGSFSINTGPKTTLPNNLFLHSVLEFWSESDAGLGSASSSLRADRLLFGEKTPGRLFALTERELLDRVAQLPDLSDGGLTISETAGVVQIYKNQDRFNDLALKNKWLNNE